MCLYVKPVNTGMKDQRACHTWFGGLDGDCLPERDDEGAGSGLAAICPGVYERPGQKRRKDNVRGRVKDGRASVAFLPNRRLSASSQIMQKHARIMEADLMRQRRLTKSAVRRSREEEEARVRVAVYFA